MKLNLGCNIHQPEGWINADIREELNPDVLLPMSEEPLWEGALSSKTTNNPLPWENDTFDQVLLSHVLEHIWLEEVPPFLHEIRRITKTGGQLLIICPDVNTLVRSFVGLNNHGALGAGAPPHNWYIEPPMNGNVEKPWSTETVIEHLFSELVLEDDRRLRDAAAVRRETSRFGKLALPHSDHKWNSYGNRLLEIVQEVYPSSELLGTNGIPEEIRAQGMDTGLNGSLYEFQWTDPNSGYVWNTASWTSATCSVLSTR